MRSFFVLSLLLASVTTFAQSLQLHYDLRHTFDSKHTTQNFPTLYFEYFKNSDTGKIAKNLGPFQIKTQADFIGNQSNISQFYMQVFQQFRFWKPKVYINLQYAGGLGVTIPREYSYYIVNTYSAGISFPFKIGSAYLSNDVDFRYSAYQKASHDLSYTFYFWQGLFNYKAEFSGDFTIWTQNRNHGDDLTAGMQGKQLSFFAEPQVWYKINKTFAVGSKVNMYYHVLNASNMVQIYPTAAIRLRL